MRRVKEVLVRYSVLFYVLLLLLLGVGIAGCGSEVPGTIFAVPTITSAPPTLEPRPTTGVSTVSPDARDVVVRAREDLADRLGTSPQAIELVSVESVEWPDASLGCPQPGRTYAQVVTPGFRVILEAEGERYVYHTDREETVVLCEEGSMMATPTGLSPVESGLENLVRSAKEDLAQRLSINLEQIDVVEARSVVWPDASLGCPLPGMAYKQVPQDGALIRLRAGGSVYEYHSGGTRGLFLCEQPEGTSKSTPESLHPNSSSPGSEDD